MSVDFARWAPSTGLLLLLMSVLALVRSNTSIGPAFYAVLPIFALANAGVAWSAEVVAAQGQLVSAIILGLVLGKPTGILVTAWLAVRPGLAVKPATCSWRQLAGAGALAGIGFTMSLFIAAQAFPRADDFTAAKIAIFAASLLAGTLGVLVLWRPYAMPEDG